MKSSPTPSQSPSSWHSRCKPVAADQSPFPCNQQNDRW